MLNKVRLRRLQLHDCSRNPEKTLEIPKKKLEISVPIISLDLCTFLQQSFCNPLALSKTCSSFDDAAKITNLLAQTNRLLNKYVNKQEKILELIKEMSHQFLDFQIWRLPKDYI